MAFQPDPRFTNGAPGGWGQPAVVGGTDAATLDAGLRSYMLRVYNWMASGLLLTGAVAWLIANNPAVQSVFWQMVQTRAGYTVPQPTMLGYAAIFAPLAFVLVLSFGINRLSTSSAQALFWAFCAVMGASMSQLFLLYTGTSVARTFFITAGMFGAISLYGYTTRSDLTRLGSFMMMGLIGIILAGVVNMFVGSTALQLAISMIGVVVFVGLTAYDTQRIKADYVQYAYAEGGEMAGKRSVMDALGLYLNFVNLFQLMLQLTGTRSSNN